MSHRIDNRVEVAAGIILDEDKVLIAKRPNCKHQGGLWEFPGGKIESSETLEEALSRELNEELDIQVIQCEFYKKIDFDYSDKKVSLSFCLVSKFSGNPKGMEGQIIKWVLKDELINYKFPEANQRIIDNLLMS